MSFRLRASMNKKLKNFVIGSSIFLAGLTVAGCTDYYENIPTPIIANQFNYNENKIEFRTKHKSFYDWTQDQQKNSLNYIDFDEKSIGFKEDRRTIKELYFSKENERVLDAEVTRINISANIKDAEFEADSVVYDYYSTKKGLISSIKRMKLPFVEGKDPVYITEFKYDSEDNLLERVSSEGTSQKYTYVSSIGNSTKKDLSSISSFVNNKLVESLKFEYFMIDKQEHALQVYDLESSLFIDQITFLHYDYRDGWKEVGKIDGLQHNEDLFNDKEQEVYPKENLNPFPHSKPSLKLFDKALLTGPVTYINYMNKEFRDYSGDKYNLWKYEQKEPFRFSSLIHFEGGKATSKLYVNYLEDFNTFNVNSTRITVKPKGKQDDVEVTTYFYEKNPFEHPDTKILKTITSTNDNMITEFFRYDDENNVIDDVYVPGSVAGLKFGPGTMPIRRSSSYNIKHLIFTITKEQNKLPEILIPDLF